MFLLLFFGIALVCMKLNLSNCPGKNKKIETIFNDKFPTIDFILVPLHVLICFPSNTKKEIYFNNFLSWHLCDLRQLLLGPARFFSAGFVLNCGPTVQKNKTSTDVGNLAPE